MVQREIGDHASDRRDLWSAIWLEMVATRGLPLECWARKIRHAEQRFAGPREAAGEATAGAADQHSMARSSMWLGPSIESSRGKSRLDLPGIEFGFVRPASDGGNNQVRFLEDFRPLGHELLPAGGMACGA